MQFGSKALHILALFLLLMPSVTRAEEKLKIVVILPLTGPLAEYGAAARNGLELARKDHSEGMRDIEFLYEDSQYDNRKALSAYQSLKNMREISLIYVWGYGPAQALIPLAETDHFPLIAVTAERSALEHRRYSLRFAYDGEKIATTLSDYLRAKGFKKLAVIKTELAFINGMLEGIKRGTRGDETIEVVDTYDPGDSDFKGSIVKLRKKPFDALGVFLISGQVSQFYRQSRQLGLTTITFGTDFFDSKKEVADANGTMTGAVFAAGMVKKDFAERYRAEYGQDQQLTWAANGYEFAALVNEVFKAYRGRVAADKVLAALKSATIPPARAADYSFYDTGDGAGFDFKVGMRKVTAAGIVDLNE